MLRKFVGLIYGKRSPKATTAKRKHVARIAMRGETPHPSVDVKNKLQEIKSVVHRRGDSAIHPFLQQFIFCKAHTFKNRFIYFARKSRRKVVGYFFDNGFYFFQHVIKNLLCFLRRIICNLCHT